MDSITLKNYRCFAEEQTARLAPLTLLVGENSTGKTSFLALIRALWDVAYGNQIPNFKEPPYDLGAFRDITHERGARGSRASSFEAGFEDSTLQQGNARRSFSVKFEERAAAPFPVTRTISENEVYLEVHTKEFKGERNEESIIFKMPKGELRFAFPSFGLLPMSSSEMRIRRFLDLDQAALEGNSNRWEKSWEGDNDVSEEYILQELHKISLFPFRRMFYDRPFATGPVRSRPQRTYDPSYPQPYPEGGYIPTHLADLYRNHPEVWDDLKHHLQEFGKESGLFDEITVKSLGKTSAAPFQIHVRKSKGKSKGPWRNLIDVGYGVSQTLPILTELLRADSPPTFLLQQPEIHLHPSAQAALGSLFCTIVGTRKSNRTGHQSSGRQLIVETHSDYIIDRVRMGVRDPDTNLTPDDVSILFFERVGLDVKIHSIRIDDQGNILGAPPSYGQFFINELNRSIGLG